MSKEYMPLISLLILIVNWRGSNSCLRFGKMDPNLLMKILKLYKKRMKTKKICFRFNNNRSIMKK